MYYRIHLIENNLYLYVKCEDFREFMSTVQFKTDVIVTHVVESEDLPKGDLIPVVSCQVINPKTVF